MGTSIRPTLDQILMFSHLHPSAIKWNMGETNLQKVCVVFHMEEHEHTDKKLYIGRNTLCIFSYA